MRTTLDIADDVLHAAEQVAQAAHKSVGEVISELARSALADGAADASSEFARAVRDYPICHDAKAPL